MTRSVTTNIRMCSTPAALRRALVMAGCLFAWIGATAQSPNRLTAHAIDLAEKAAWEYRLVTDGQEGPWTSALQDLASGVKLPASHITWPTRWVTFGAGDNGTGAKGRNDDPAAFAEVPSTMTLNGASACRATLPVDERGTLDLSWGHGEPAHGRWAYAFAQVEMAEAQDIVVAAAADGPMAWWVDGKAAFTTPRTVGTVTISGLPGYAFSLHLSKGPHVLAVRVESGTTEWRLTTTAAPAPWPAARTLQARCVFGVKDPSAFVSLTFAGPDADRVQLNGQPLSRPFPRLYYTEVPGLSPALLRAGENVLTKEWAPGEVDQLLLMAAGRKEGALLGLPPGTVSIINAACIVGATESSLTIMCRTNAPVPCVLKIAGRAFRSQPGLVHEFIVDGLRAGTAYPYTVTPACTGAALFSAKRAIARTLPAAGPLTIGIGSDPQGGAATLAKVARRLRNARPDMMVFCGDMVADGLVEASWKADFFGPMWQLASEVPVYAVRGNHDRRAPLFDRFFAEPRGGRNWAQEVAGVLLVGIDGQYDWRPGGACAQWLETTLAASKARFIFVFNHYPAYSSTTHGRLNEDGRVNDPAGRAAREVIYPIMQRYGVTAYFTGHDHGYERSEPPGGVTSITTAGAGAGTYKKRDDPLQNPYSKVCISANHYSVLQIEGDSAMLTAFAVDGRKLDSVTWTARMRR